MAWHRTMNYFGELFCWVVFCLCVVGVFVCFSFFIAYEKNNSKNSNPNPTPFSIIQNKTCLGIRSCTWQSAFHIWCLSCCLLHPSATQPIIYWCCSLLRSKFHRAISKDRSGREWKDLSTEHFGLSTLCQVPRQSSYRRNRYSIFEKLSHFLVSQLIYFSD